MKVKLLIRGVEGGEGGNGREGYVYNSTDILQGLGSCSLSVTPGFQSED